MNNTNDGSSFLDNMAQAQFLNEPVWRWAVLGIAVFGLSFSWRGVIGYIK